jgi:hypothetical protein
MLHLGPSQGEKKERDRGKESEGSDLTANPTVEEEEDEKEVGHNWKHRYREMKGVSKLLSATPCLPRPIM